MQNKAVFLFSRSDLEHFLGENTVSKGEIYQKKGWVSQLKVDQLAEEISSRVRGKEKSHYKVVVKLRVKPQKTLSIHGSCSCYMSYNCKHVAATLLQFLSQPPASIESATTLDAQQLQSRFLSSPPTTLRSTATNANWISFLENREIKESELSLAPQISKKNLITGVPVPVLHLMPHPLGSQLIDNQAEPSALAVLNFQYGKSRIEASNPARVIENTARDFSQETEYLDVLRSMDIQENQYSSGIFLIGLDFVFNHLPTLKKQNWIIEVDPAFPLKTVQEESWYTQASESTDYDWFSFELGISVEGQKINILPILVNLIRKYPKDLNLQTVQAMEDNTPFYLRLPDGRYVEVFATRIKNILSVLVELYNTTPLQEGTLKVRAVQAGQLLGLQQSLQARWLGGKTLKQLGERLMHFEGIEPCCLPKGLKGQLRSYQKEGVDWLNFLREFNLGGILADDMGLGKTIQVLTHLLAEKESGRQKGPNLIIAPTSLMANWANECRRFTPDLNVLILQGTHRHLNFERMALADLILTTYPLINRDKAILLQHSFYYLILDEAQFIKNPYTKSYHALLEIQARHTLCMTGTPMENHLGELWALFHFTVPGLLGDNKSFKKFFRDPIEREGDMARQKNLSARLKPFMLRRTKEQVATELPVKTEIIHQIELTGAQLDLYESIRLAMQQKVVQAVKEKGLMRSQIVILDALLKLRQICNDPRLLSFERAKAVHHCAKRTFLMEMLTTLIEEGRKILLFSSFATMLDLLEIECLEKKIPYVKLTGQTQDRVTVIHQFQEGHVPLMLISLKAGGVGLNLTAADTVIFYDPWWNPAAEAQATDRAHRLGQTKPVFVYKLICRGTVEEKILKMQENKKRLLKNIFKTDENQSTKLSAEDIAYLFESNNEEYT